jgi:SAM-dependent methyltransferase
VDGSGYRSANRSGWDQLSRTGHDSSVPWSVDRVAPEVAMAWLDRNGWLPWDEVATVLVVGGGGGQQAPLFAQLGYEVTVVDLSPEQLRRDQEVAGAVGLELETVEGDMCDLSVLGRRRFDLVYQPVSSCYVPDVRSLYRSVASVTKPRGWYWSEHWNPVQIQVSPDYSWDGSAYRLDRSMVDHDPRVYAGVGIDEQPLCWHFIHSVGDLVGGICDAGFTIQRFAERSDIDPSAAPGSTGHLASFVATFYTTLARRRLVARR